MLNVRFNEALHWEVYTSERKGVESQDLRHYRECDGAVGCVLLTTLDYLEWEAMESMWVGMESHHGIHSDGLDWAI